ncbi:MAG: BrnT family toxin [Rickettsiales bacterium]
MFEWDETKRQANLAKHGVDFRLAALVFAGPTLEAPDEREDYGEDRTIALGRVGSDILWWSTQCAVTIAA